MPPRFDDAQPVHERGQAHPEAGGERGGRRRLELEQGAVERVLGRRQGTVPHRLGQEAADRLVEREDLEQQRGVERIRAHRRCVRRAHGTSVVIMPSAGSLPLAQSSAVSGAEISGSIVGRLSSAETPTSSDVATLTTMPEKGRVMPRELPYAVGQPPIGSPTITTSVWRSSRATNRLAAENVFRPVM